MQKASSLLLKLLKRAAIAMSILVVIVFLVIVWMSPGKTSPIVDARGRPIPNSIAAIEQPVIGGMAQTLIIRGENSNNPVLLIVHGGPGMSALPFVKEQFKGMEKLFTICYWEQRGAGRSYSSKIPPGSMTLEQLMADGIEVSRYLIKKFHQQKIYILGHSWGSLLASFIIHEHPALYHAYIGIGQVANTTLSEQGSYQFVLAEAKRRHDHKALEELEQLKMPAPDASGQEWYDYLRIERKKVFRYGGTWYGVKGKASDLILPLLTCREYTIRDKINFKAGFTFSMLHLWKYMVQRDPATLLTEQKIPVYIFQGKHDHQTGFDVAKAYFDQLKAPVKRFYAFERSAHFPHTEEYEAFEKIIQTDILGKKE